MIGEAIELDERQLRASEASLTALLTTVGQNIDTVSTVMASYSADGSRPRAQTSKVSKRPSTVARRQKTTLPLSKTRYLDAKPKRSSMGVLKSTAYSRHLDDIDLPQHVDPKNLICDQCNTPTAVCCTAQCAPPSKRRATSIEIDRVKRPLVHNNTVLGDTMDDCCFKPCDEPNCGETEVISCVGDAHCPSKTACDDPECEGAPCFQPSCESPPCLDDTCPDNTCPEGGPPNVDNLCQFDPWNCCDDLPEGIFNDPSLFSEHWEQFHAEEHGGHHHIHPPPTAQPSGHLHPTIPGSQTSLDLYSTDPMSPAFLNSIDPLNSYPDSLLPSQLSAAETLAYLQHDHIPGGLFNPSANSNSLGYTYTGFHGTPQQAQYSDSRAHGTPFSHHLSPSIATSVHSRMSDPSLTPSSTLDGSMAASREASQSPFYTPNLFPQSYGHMHTFSNASILDSQMPQMPDAQVKHEAPPDSDISFICKWTIGGSYTCGRECASSEDLQNHIRDEHVRIMKGELKCQWQGCRNEGDFKQRSKLTRHVQTHAGYRPHVCPWEGCGQSFGTKQTMDNHLKTHEQVKPYKCRYCDVTATTPTQIKTHENSVHLGKKRFKCKFCDFACTDSSNLSKHEKTHRKRTFKCLHEGCNFKPDCRWENAKRHFAKTGHCPELLVKGSDAQERYKRDAMAAAAEGDDELMKSQLQTFLDK